MLFVDERARERGARICQTQRRIINCRQNTCADKNDLAIYEPLQVFLKSFVRLPMFSAVVDLGCITRERKEISLFEQNMVDMCVNLAVQSS